MRKLLTFSLLYLLIGVSVLMAQAPTAFNYQGVARDNLGNPLVNTTINLRLSVVRVSDNNIRYQEFQQTPTNQLGLFAVEFGKGTLLSNGPLSSVDWNQGPFNLRVEMDPNGGGNFALIGESELLSVPYALFANAVGGNVDTSVTNELQTLSKSGNNITLSGGGGLVPDAVDDADNNPNNEIQTLSVVGNTLTISGSGGNTVTLPPDADNNTSNELQSISLSGTSLSLSSGGGTVTVDNSISNEIQALSLTGSSLTLSNGGGTVTIDADASNEFQTLASSGDTLSISNGNTVTLDDDDWLKSGNNLYFSKGNIGISTPGNPSPVSSFYRIYSYNDASITGATRNMYLYQNHNISSTAYGLYSNLNNSFASSNSSYGIYSTVYKGSSGTGGAHYAFYGTVSNLVGSGSSTSTYGGYFSAYRSSSVPSSTTYGIYARAYGSGTSMYAGYFSGDVFYTGTFGPSDRKLKKNISPLTGALAIVNSLNVYEYEYDTEKYPYMNLPEGTQRGLLADELEAVMPNLVKSTIAPAPVIEEETAIDYVGEGNYGAADEDGMVKLGEDVDFKAVNYPALIPVLIQSVKEQQAEIELIQQKIDKLETKLEK